MVKNIAFFLNTLASGGAERVVSRLSSTIKKFNVYIFLIENRKQFYDCAGKIVVFGNNKYSYRINMFRTLILYNKLIKKYKIDCVISFLDVPNIINSLFNRNAKKIISIRDCNETLKDESLMELLKDRICRYCFRKADKMISVSMELNEIAIAKYAFQREHAVVIENPYNVDEIEAYGEQTIEPEIMSFISAHKTAVAVGRLNEQKGYDDLLEIFELVHNECKDAALLIIGEGNLLSEIEKIIMEKNLSDSVMIVGAKKNPFAYMKKCDIYVSASRHEGFPNTLVEAMACGLPVIHSDCKTGPREILTEKEVDRINNDLFFEYGILVPSYTRGDISKEKMVNFFYDAWVILLKSNEMRDKYSHKARQRAKYYNTERCVNKYIDVINME